MNASHRLLIAAAVVLGLAASETRAQARTSLGVGFNSVVSTEQGLGIGFRFRGARALNEDISLAAGVGITGFVLGGRDDASYLIDPQVSLIVTIGSPQPDRATYVMGGIGGHLPTNASGAEADGDDGWHEDSRGPYIHAGMGWVRGLYSTRLFYEFDPALIIGESGIDLMFPFRIGVIF